MDHHTYVPVGYSKVLITNITPTDEIVYAVFIDPQDDVEVVQQVIVWAVIEFYKNNDEGLPDKTLVRGLTELPDSPYLTDNVIWNNNFVGYFRPNAPDIANDSNKRLNDMVADYKRRQLDVERETGRDTTGTDTTDPAGEEPPGNQDDGEVIGRTDPNFWKGKLPGNPDWTE